MNILKDEQIGEHFFRAEKRLKETAGNPQQYNEEEFLTFSKKILVELLEAQVRETLKRLLPKDYYPRQLAVWAERLKEELCYESTLIAFLRELATNWEALTKEED